MGKRLLVSVLAFLLVVITLADCVQAEVTFDYGASLRLRQEIWDNVVTLSTIPSQPDRDFFRLRYSLWGSVDIDKTYGGYLRFTGEPKYYLGNFPQWFLPNEPRNASRLTADELIFDNLYFDARKVLGSPVNVRFGRQDFLGPNTYGEGFLMMDGTPGDGSRTFYFNAAKVNINFSKDFSLDLIGISDPEFDIYMPSLHEDDTKVRLTGSNEQGVVVYGRGKVDNFVFEPYYIWKTEKTIDTPVPYSTGRLDLNTIGARLLYSRDSWKLGGEFAYQFGSYGNTGTRGGQDRTGYGGYAFVGRKYDTMTFKPEWDVRYVYLSGDKPGTKDKNETWDPLFSRNPYWNELIIYTLIPETTQYGGPIPGYWTNMEIIKASLKLNFTPATNLTLAYQYLWAPQSTCGPQFTGGPANPNCPVTGLPAAMFTNSGHSRGSLPTALLYQSFSKNIDGYLQFEYFLPRSFYSGAAENAIFFRWQLQFKI